MPVPFATNGQRTEILSDSVSGSNEASYPEGFPAITMLDESAGGAPPLGQNFNQILFELSSAMRWSNAGGLYPFDNSFSTSIGGYPLGARVVSNDGLKIYKSLVDDNTTDPNSSSSSGWDIEGDEISGRYLGVKVFTSSGTYSPSSDVTIIRVTVVGGGGSGSGCSGKSTAETISGGGGGGGGTSIATVSVSSGTSYPIVVGGGGAATKTTVGNSGSSSSFNGAIISNGGGGGGSSVNSYSPGGFGGSSSGGNINISGGDGSDGQYGSLVFTGNGGSSFFSGGGRAGNSAGFAGKSYGSGGGGVYDGNMSGTAYSSGPGSSGVVIIEEFS